VAPDWVIMSDGVAVNFNSTGYQRASLRFVLTSRNLLCDSQTAELPTTRKRGKLRVALG
jgi:hypothetical protein